MPHASQLKSLDQSQNERNGQIQLELRRVNTLLALALLKLFRLRGNTKEVVHACRDLMGVVNRGNFWVGCWEDLLRIQSKQRNESVSVITGAVCENCSVRWCSDAVGESGSDPSWKTEVDDVLACWTIQIEHLFLLMTTVATTLQMQAESTSFDHLIDCLSVLNRLLQRQHVLLQQFEPPHIPEYSMEQTPDRCVYCGTEEGLV